MKKADFNILGLDALEKKDDKDKDNDKDNDKALININSYDFNEKNGNLHIFDNIDCALCKNKGFISKIVFHERLVMFYEVFEICFCEAKWKSYKIGKKSGLNQLLNKNSSHFLAKSPMQVKIKNSAIKFILENKFLENWWCICGLSGSGKTLICSIICNALINKNFETFYINWVEFIRTLKSFAFETPQKFETYFEEYKNIKVLYIDDFFKGSSTETDLSYAFRLINYRYNNNLVTIFSTEKMFVDLMKLDEAVASRIKEKCGDFFIENYEKENYRLKEG